MYKSLLFLFALVSIMSSNAQGADKGQTSTVKFDEDNYVVRLADDIRVIGEFVNSIGEVIRPYERRIVLQFHNDGVTTTARLMTSSGSDNPISNFIWTIKYADPTHVWIISRMGRNSDGAVLVDTLTGTILKRYRSGFLLSDDGGHIAIMSWQSFSTDRKVLNTSVKKNKVLFIGDHLIYPELRMNYYWKNGPKLSKNMPPYINKGMPSTPYEINNMHWEGDMFRFVVREVTTPAEEMEKAFKENRLSYRNWLYVYRIQGRPEYLGGKGDRIEQVSKTELSTEEYQALAKMDFENISVENNKDKNRQVVPLESE